MVLIIIAVSISRPLGFQSLPKMQKAVHHIAEAAQDDRQRSSCGFADAKAAGPAAQRPPERYLTRTAVQQQRRSGPAALQPAAGPPSSSAKPQALKDDASEDATSCSWSGEQLCMQPSERAHVTCKQVSLEPSAGARYTHRPGSRALTPFTNLEWLCYPLERADTMGAGCAELPASVAAAEASAPGLCMSTQPAGPWQLRQARGRGGNIPSLADAKRTSASGAARMPALSTQSPSVGNTVIPITSSRSVCEAGSALMPYQHSCSASWSCCCWGHLRNRPHLLGLRASAARAANMHSTASLSSHSHVKALLMVHQWRCCAKLYCLS